MIGCSSFAYPSLNLRSSYSVLISNVKGRGKRKNFLGSKNIIKTLFVQIWTKLLHFNWKILDFYIFGSYFNFAPER